MIIIEGFGSSGLVVKEGSEEWIGQRVWLSLGKLGDQKLRTIARGLKKSTPANPLEREAEQAFKVLPNWPIPFLQPIS